MNQEFKMSLNLQEQKRLLQTTNSKKYHTIILLMLDCGLRVSEVIQLQCQHVIFSENKIKSFVDEYGLSFPILLDEKGEVERLYPSMTIPFTYIIDRQGRIVARVDGAKNWESSETFEAIEYLLKNQRVEHLGKYFRIC